MTGTPEGVLEHVAPTALILEENVRPSAPLTPDFIRSVKENGVLTPVLAHRMEDGSVVVRAGQRRTLAAREAELTSMPVYIVTADEATTQRIVQQLVENDQREELTTSERVEAFKQLSFEGMNLREITKRTGEKPAVVKSALAVGKSSAASSAAREHQLTLEQADALVEFEADAAAFARLVETAQSNPARLDHVAQELRDQRAREEAVESLRADYLSRGWNVLQEHPGWRDDKFIQVGSVLTSDGESVTESNLAEVPERTVYMQRRYNSAPHPELYLPVPLPAGFRKRWGAPEVSAEEKAERKAAEEAEKAEREAALEAWKSATTVRRAWLTEFLQRKKLPTDAVTVVARGLTASRSALEQTLYDNELAHVLMQLPVPDMRDPDDDDHLSKLITTRPASALQVALAVVLAAAEEYMGQAHQAQHGATSEGAEYLQLLQAWGYSLSEVETARVERAAAAAVAAAERAAELAALEAAEVADDEPEEQSA
ncbi:ParB/RepB/Spo0J family partition protein [Pseudoclavibacter helvolus]|uniref:ParB family chromosome partitioning protein n=1 Tax=Pseudoclavibacter helvolus TaxID=255205 RepID=A0A7W4ULQ8_9MICO|nr:ParB N-terminal domain-containing protein [Pseudoclavibacter helvolus]MBB2956814.1 ParB family chromosome partitioning protein [Pseudoclavibacter helvolus]